MLTLLRKFCECAACDCPIPPDAMKIIVNADDLGISELVNEAIFQGMRRGTITSATMLSNGPAVKAAAQILHLFPDVLLACTST